jgi:hypothetical protein
VKDAALGQKKSDQQPSDAAVAIKERVDRFELNMREGMAAKARA